MDRSGDFEAEQPRPLMRPVDGPEQFPIEALGDILGGAARSIVDMVQVPDAMAAQSVLATASLAAQGLVDIELPTGQRRPVSCFFITVAASGERKSAGDRIATHPIIEREKELRKRYQADREDYELKRDAYEAERRRILNAKNRAEREEQLQELGAPPNRPLEPLLTCPEPTIEGLHRLLAEGQPSVGLFSDEGGQFIAGHGMSDENRLKTSAALSSLWDGDPVKRVRGGDGVVILPGRRVAMHLMAQPDAAARWLCDPVLADQGLLSRLLTAAPASLPGTRLWREPDPASRSELRRYGARLHALFQRPLPMTDGVGEGLTPSRDQSRPEPFVGWVLHAHSIRWAIENGFGVYDFCHGNEAYKYSYGAKNRHVKYATIRTRSGVNLNDKIDPACISDVMNRTIRFLETDRLKEARTACQQVYAATQLNGSHAADL